MAVHQHYILVLHIQPCQNNAKAWKWLSTKPNYPKMYTALFFFFLNNENSLKTILFWEHTKTHPNIYCFKIMKRKTGKKIFRPKAELKTGQCECVLYRDSCTTRTHPAARVQPRDESNMLKSWFSNIMNSPVMKWALYRYGQKLVWFGWCGYGSDADFNALTSIPIWMDVSQNAKKIVCENLKHNFPP